MPAPTDPYYTPSHYAQLLLSAGSSQAAVVADPSLGGTADDTAYLQGLIDSTSAAGQKLVIPWRLSGWTVAGLVPKNNSKVDATGASFHMPAATQKRFLLNKSLTLASPWLTRDSNISWRGGTFTKTASQSNNSSLDDMMLMFGFVDGLDVTDITVNQTGTGNWQVGTGGTYGLYLYGVSRVGVRNYTANSTNLTQNQSTIQLMGACSDIVISGVYGSFGDDCVAPLPRNATALEIAGAPVGDIQNLRIEDIFATSASNGVRLNTGSTDASVPLNLKNVSVRNVHGDFAARPGCAAVLIGGDTSGLYPTLSNGFATGITVENVQQTRATTPAVLISGSSECFGIVLRSVNNRGDSTAVVVASTIGHAGVKIADCDFTTAITTGSYFPVSNASGGLRSLHFDNVRLNAATTGTATVGLVDSTANLPWLVASNIRTTGRVYALGRFAGITRVMARGVLGEDTFGLGWFNTVTGAVVVVREFSGLSSSTVDDFIKTAGTVTSDTPTFRCDMSKLVRSVGGQCFNTNTGLTPVTGTMIAGPWVCDGTTWKSLTNAATF